MAINLNVTRADSSEYDAQLLLGIKGDPGKSAYEYAVDAGYTGTETDFTLLMESLEEFQDVTATAETLDAGESATASFSDGELSLGIPKGYSAGFGTVSATVDANHGVPAVTVTASGEDTAKNFAFAFSNLQPAPYDDSVIQARMDSFTNLEEGSTTGDAELIDGRVGADGVTYTNIGDAIRGQITDLKSDFNDIAVYYSDTSIWTVGAIDVTDGTETVMSTRIRSAYLPDDVVSVKPTNSYSYLILAYNNDNTFAGRWDGSALVTTTVGLVWNTGEIFLHDIGNYKFRVVAKNAGGTNMNTSEGANIKFRSYTDLTLSKSGKPADAKVTGDKITNLDNTLDEILSTKSATIENTLNAVVNLSSKKIANESYERSVYAKLSDNAYRVTVEKTAGKRFIVAFTADEPANNVSIIDDSDYYINAGEADSASLLIPSGAEFVIASVWNANLDTTTDSAMIASVKIIESFGAIDNLAREDIEELQTKTASIEEIKRKTHGIIATGYNYLNDAIEDNPNYYWNAGGGDYLFPTSLSPNSDYRALLIPVESKKYKFAQTVRFITPLDANRKMLATSSSDVTAYDNTAVEAVYLAISAYTSTYASQYMYDYDEQAYELYHATGKWVFDDASVGENIHIFLPSKIYCAVGRTIELYNEQVVLEADKYHIRWTCTKGVAYKRKFSITGIADDIGSYTLNLKIYNDSYKVVAEKSATLIICADNLSSTKIVPIGDSLTEGKLWLSEIPTLSSSEIEFIGTRKSASNYISEGRAGVGSAWYVADSSYTYADGSTYIGNSGVQGSSNPFWDGSKFSLSHYITEQSAYVGTPDAVQIFLGTNELFYPDTAVENLKTIVDTIHTEYPTMPVFICLTIFHSNQNGYHTSGGQGYVGIMNSWQYMLDIATIDFMNALADGFDNDTYSSFVTLVPLVSTMDREYDFGQVEVTVNPRSTVKELIPTEYTHPQASGYLQMADEIYSAYCAVLT